MTEPEEGTVIDPPLFVKDVAAWRGMSLSAARAWLVELENTYGRSVVQRAGKRLFTRASALEQVLPGAKPCTRDFHRLEVRLARMERRLDAVAQKLVSAACGVAADDL